MKSRKYFIRNLKNNIFVIFSILSLLFCLFWLFWIIGVILYNGLSALSLSVFTELTPGPQDSGGGLANAIVGSIIILIVALVIGTPLGIMCGIYLAEYGKKSKLAEIMRVINDVLLSAPSIVMGLFVYIVIVMHMDGFSAFAGSVSLALIQIPIVTRTTENMLSLVPNTLRESAFALGVPRYLIILKITMKSSIAGILTGILLSLARIAGETGPLLFTSLNNQFWNLNAFDGPMASLPMTIFKFAMSPYERWQDLAWVGVLLITTSIFMLNIVAKYIARKTNK